jgi:hypothetical protein
MNIKDLVSLQYLCGNNSWIAINDYLRKKIHIAPDEY